MPKHFYDISEKDRDFAQATFAHDRDEWIHTITAMALIDELLKLAPNKYLNKAQLTARLLLIAQRANQFHLQNSKQFDEDAANESDETRGSGLTSYLINMQRIALSTRSDIHKVVSDASIQHSYLTLTEQSDKVLEWISNHPYPFASRAEEITRDQKAWLSKHMPAMLHYFKQSSLCSLACAGVEEWPPRKVPTKRGHRKRESGVQTIEEFNHIATAPTGLKNAILAYHHGLSVKTMSNYLQKCLPRTARKS